MSITKADLSQLIAERKKHTKKLVKEIVLHGKLAAVTIALTTSVTIGLPNVTYTGNGFTMNASLESLGALGILVIGLLALREWLK